MDKNIRREIILDAYKNPYNNKKIGDPSYIKINTNNESCIDNLDIYFKIENNIVKDVAFMGEACAISTSATSIMLSKIANKSVQEVRKLLENYKNMISEKEYDSDILEELNAYDEIYLQPNRKNCALLPVKAIEKALERLENED